jgi:hypothetical protein
VTGYQTELENEAARLFAGTHQVLAPISEHIAQVKSRGRDLSGVGFFTTFEYLPGLTPMQFSQPWTFAATMSGKCDEMPDGFSLLFFVDGGFLSMIEGLANEDEWKIESKARLAVHPLDYEYRFLTPPYLDESGL